MFKEVAIDSEYQSTLQYYKNKVNNLEKQREAWLAKFDECNSSIQKKQEKQSEFRKLKGRVEQKKKDIIHHQIAEIDEQLASLNMDRQNQAIEFEQASSLIKMKQLIKDNPINIEKQLPCFNTVKGSELIENDLNIHSSGKYRNNVKKVNQSLNLSRRIKSKVPKKQASQVKSIESLLRLRIIQNKKLNQQQLVLLEHQKELLKISIINLRKSEQNKLKNQRKIINDFTKKQKTLQKDYKKLAEAYLEFKKDHQKKFNNSVKENTTLKKKYARVEDKLKNHMLDYEKQNKAKQILIFKKSQDFLQNYKSKMRAKQKNLQSLKENYQKMQQVCIKKVRKFEATLEKAQYKLQDSQERRKFIVQELRDELQNLQKKYAESLRQKAKLNIKLQQKLEEQKNQKEEKREKVEATQYLAQKNELFKNAYKKTRIPSNNKIKKIDNRKLKNNNQSESENDSLDMSDLDKIQKQINHLQNKIISEDQIV